MNKALVTPPYSHQEPFYTGSNAEQITAEVSLLIILRCLHIHHRMRLRNAGLRDFGVDAVLHKPPNSQQNKPDGHEHQTGESVFIGSKNPNDESKERKHDPACHHAAGHGIGGLPVQVGRFAR